MSQKTNRIPLHVTFLYWVFAYAKKLLSLLDLGPVFLALSTLLLGK